MKNFFLRYTAVLILVSGLSGCASAQILQSGETHVRLADNGRIYVGDTYTGLSKLAAQLKKNGVEPQTQIKVEIPANTPPSALSAIGRELASNGYRRFIFNKPRKTSAEKGLDPILKNLQ